MSIRLSFLSYLFLNCLVGGLSCNAEPASLNSFAIEWKVTKNRVPPSVWIYKVVPVNFSPKTISNWMTLGSFTQADKKEIHKLASPETRDALFFANADESRYLGIAPHLGWITYHDQSAIAETGKYPQGIPTEEEALNRAVKYLSLLGIDRRDLAVKNNGDLRIYREKGGRGWMDKAKNTNVYETITRGVDFIRRVDGIDFDGIGIRQGICFTFGDYGKITELELNWKGMERLECHQTLTREQMIDAIRKGRAKFTPAPGSPIEKLVVMDVVPFYRGGSDQEDVKFIEPYARITASVAYDTTNTVVNIETSILGSKQ